MDFWEWFTLIGGIIGGVAFLMAVQPFTQFIWGQPKIVIEPHTGGDNSFRTLDVYLTNMPVKNFILRALHIHRMTADDVWVSFRIRDRRSGNWITELCFPNLGAAREDDEKQIALASSYVPASFLLVSTNNGKAMLALGDDDKEIYPGKYEIELEVHYSEKNIGNRMTFSVGTQPYELFWEDDTKS